MGRSRNLAENWTPAWLHGRDHDPQRTMVVAHVAMRALAFLRPTKYIHDDAIAVIKKGLPSNTNILTRSEKRKSRSTIDPVSRETQSVLNKPYHIGTMKIDSVSSSAPAAASADKQLGTQPERTSQVRPLATCEDRPCRQHQEQHHSTNLLVSLASVRVQEDTEHGLGAPECTSSQASVSVPTGNFGASKLRRPELQVQISQYDQLEKEVHTASRDLLGFSSDSEDVPKVDESPSGSVKRRRSRPSYLAHSRSESVPCRIRDSPKSLMSKRACDRPAELSVSLTPLQAVSPTSDRPKTDHSPSSLLMRSGGSPSVRPKQTHRNSMSWEPSGSFAFRQPAPLNSLGSSKGCGLQPDRSCSSSRRNSIRSIQDSDRLPGRSRANTASSKDGGDESSIISIAETSLWTHLGIQEARGPTARSSRSRSSVGDLANDALGLSSFDSIFAKPTTGPSSAKSLRRRSSWHRLGSRQSAETCQPSHLSTRCSLTVDRTRTRAYSDLQGKRTPFRAELTPPRIESSPIESHLDDPPVVHQQHVAADCDVFKAPARPRYRPETESSGIVTDSNSHNGLSRLIGDVSTFLPSWSPFPRYGRVASDASTPSMSCSISVIGTDDECNTGLPDGPMDGFRWGSQDSSAVDGSEPMSGSSPEAQEKRLEVRDYILKWEELDDGEGYIYRLH